MSRMSAVLNWLVPLVSLASLAACAPEEEAAVCTAGTGRECPCIGGATGTQSCLADGGGYAVCMCPSSAPEPAAAACVPGQSTACACMGGATGTQSCLADGAAYGACACPMEPSPAVESQAGGTAGMAAPAIDFPACPEAYTCEALPAAPGDPVCLDPASAQGFPLPPPCEVTEDCAQYGLNVAFTDCIDTAPTGYDYGKLCFTGCTP